MKKLFFVLSTTLLFALGANASNSEKPKQYTGEREMTCRDYDGENLMIIAKLIYFESNQKYRVRVTHIGYKEDSLMKSEQQSTTTYTYPESGILRFSTDGAQSAYVDVTINSKYKNTFSGTAQAANSALYTVNCTYTGPEFARQAE